MSEDTAKKRGLGRGLAALLGDDAGEDYAALDRLRQPKEIPTGQIKPSRFQPRVRFDDEAMDDLVRSVREKGILQPILVRRAAAENTYEIIAGERRWRAAQKAQLHQVPVIIREFNDAEALEVALVENLQRQDLNAVEEANGYLRLIEEFHHTQDRLAEIVGKSRSHVANTLRLLGLPDDIRAMVVDGRLTAGHARTLLSAKDPHALARQIVDSKLTVRQAEDLGTAARGRSKKSAPSAKNADTVALESSLSNAIGMKVAVIHHGNKGGLLKVAYSSLEQLDDLCRRLLRPPQGPKTAPGRMDADKDDDPKAEIVPEPVGGKNQGEPKGGLNQGQPEGDAGDAGDGAPEGGASEAALADDEMSAVLELVEEAAETKEPPAGDPAAPQSDLEPNPAPKSAA